MSQRSQVSRDSLWMSISKVLSQSVTESVSQWVTRSPIELLWTAKNYRKLNRKYRDYHLHCPAPPTPMAESEGLRPESQPTSQPSFFCNFHSLPLADEREVHLLFWQCVRKKSGLLPNLPWPPSLTPSLAFFRSKKKTSLFLGWVTIRIWIKVLRVWMEK